MTEHKIIAGLREAIEVAKGNTLPARVTTFHVREEIDPRLKKALDDLARSIGRSAVNHLKEMYPDALQAVTKTAEVSLANHVRNNINHHIRPLLVLLRKLQDEGKT